MSKGCRPPLVPSETFFFAKWPDLTQLDGRVKWPFYYSLKSWQMAYSWPKQRTIPYCFLDLLTLLKIVTRLFQTSENIFDIENFSSKWWKKFGENAFWISLVSSNFVQSVNPFNHKVQILWEGHKMGKNISPCFEITKQEIFSNFCGLLRISEL